MSNNAERCVCCGREIPEGKQYCIMCGHKAEKKQTNYDRIRNMSIDELAGFISGETPCNCCILTEVQHCSLPCAVGIKQWLESEADTE